MKTYIPFDATTLPFTQLTSEQFEQYCEWLLHKDKELKNVHRIEGNGHYQGGLDICANVTKSSNKLAAYECKCWKNLSIQELDNTVKKFKQNDLISKINKYVIILAQEDVPRNIRKKWDEIHHELHCLGIETELWVARNWLDADDVAILDIHILRAGILGGFFSKNLSVEKNYLELEEEFLSFSRGLGIKASELDAVIWLEMMSSSSIVHELMNSSSIDADLKFKKRKAFIAQLEMRI